jgi:cytochrome b561
MSLLLKQFTSAFFLLIGLIVSLSWYEWKDSPIWMLVIGIICILLGVIGVVLSIAQGEEERDIPKIEKKIEGITVILLYILSFFIPLSGFIVGAIYVSKDEEHYKHVGKNCLIFSLMNIVLGFIMIALLFNI